ncbi:type IV secretory system conjugative DNA transfer family protein [Leifsonia sp. McL0607]|uniref:type IV secretory system conjugative DNA transfer family protein n=1 Tax=Leifsonia sp. McL0607 TaxID=3415672 RepID=UPI003CEB28B8
MIRHPLRTLIRYGIGLVCLFGGVPLMVQLGNLFTPTGSTYSWWAPALTASLVGRRVALPAAAPALLIVLVVFAVAGLVAVSFIRRVPRSKAKQAAKLLNKRRNVAALGRKNRAQEAARLHPNAENLAPGLELGRYKNRPTQYAYQGWRDCGIFILGTGRGKTSALVVPRMIAAPGAALMTSNKVDGVAEVIAGRKGNGTRRVFLFDNQGIYTDGEPTFTIDLLGSVKAMRHAEELAWILDDSSLPDGEPVKKDPHFDPAGRGLLSCFLFAAALEPSVHLQKVYEWIALLDGEQPERILRAAGKVGPANTVRGVMKHPEKTRGSIFAVAQRMASALGDDDLMRWTTPTRGLNVFDPDAFLRSRDTLIMLSQNGPGSGSAGVTGLLQAVCARGEQLAAANGGRLPVPLVGEVDELGNIVRWRRLPAQASHFGSKGLCINGYLQSYEQGIGIWGKAGMDAYYDACAIRVYGGGSNDEPWLGGLSRMIGPYDKKTSTVSSGRGGVNSSVGLQEAPILSTADLASMDEWDAVVFSGKARPALVRMRPWWERPDLEALVKEGLA